MKIYLLLLLMALFVHISWRPMPRRAQSRRLALQHGETNAND